MIRDKNSITRKLVVPMVIFVLIQVALFIGTISVSGIINVLKDNSFSLLKQKIESRKNYLQNDMMQHWSNIGESHDAINFYILNKLKSKGLTTKDLNSNTQLSTELLGDVSNDVVFMLRKNYVTGAFLVLDTNSEEKQGLYFRDFNPYSNPSDNSDLLMEKGEVIIARNLEIHIDNLWTNTFTFKGDGKVTSNDFFNKPIVAAKENKNLSYKDLGYWSKPFSLNDKDISMITYSVPLMDDDGKPYGVLGIAVSVNYLNSLLDYKEIDSKGNGVYILGINNGEMNIEKLIRTGPMINGIASNNKDFNLDSNKVSDSIYKFKVNESGEMAYACINDFNLYNPDTPFQNEKWVLLGAIKEDDLLFYSSRFTRLLSISLVMSSLIGIFVILIAGRRITEPIRKLVEDLRRSNSRNPLELKKINILEIDELSSEIITLSNSLLDSASKLSQIIKLFNMPIGAFEYKKGQNMVFCTETFFEVIGTEDLCKNEAYVNITDFEKIIEKIIVNKESFSEDIYRVKRKDKNIIWIKLKILEDELRTLGVVSDVTQEVLEKQKIQYERDYDLLTDILNRRAFYNIVESNIQKLTYTIGAFIMWDLDNLKYVNDTYGHDYGDEYIKRASIELKKFEEYGGIVGRRSGDEFFVFIYGYENKDEIRGIIKNIHKNIENATLRLPNNRELKIRVSAGIAWFPDDAVTFEDLSRYSDFAMYKIKRTVKGNISEFNRDEYNEESFLLSSHEDFNKIIEQGLIKYAFQPIIDAKTGKIFAYEALMRSQLDSLKNPLHIIKLATADSRLYDIEKITFFKAMEGFSVYMDKLKDVKLFVNSIPNQSLTDEDTEKFENLYGKYLNRLVVELLENERSNGENISKKRKAIERWNAQLAIDDFGSGYNNEAVLLSITPNFVKIDMGIVRGIDKDLNRQQISKNLISYAKQRKIKIVAEGVETREELEKLIELGVDYLQGYYFSKPEYIPPDISDDLINEILDINKKIN